MRKLDKTNFLFVEKHMEEHARPLELAVFKHEFYKGYEKQIIQGLAEYQNEDGGFGNGLEPDFWLPKSSPSATSVALRYLKSIEKDPQAIDMIKKAIAYLEKTYDDQRKGWMSVSMQVNDFPHAPWWNYDADLGGTAVDRQWGNPTVELIGYLYRYKKYVNMLDVNELVKQAIEYINSKPEFDDVHELYCVIRFHNELNEKDQKKIEKAIAKGAAKLINLNEEDWDKYVPVPLNFVEENSNSVFGIHINDINKNLDYLIRQLEDESLVMPSWSWEHDPEQWEKAKKDWIGILTLDAMKKLQRFERL